ncbi:MAG: hypothetical protein JNM00_00260 [Flavobacteriales bacterium]|nr:hypothetical protein [Flavobacteriales bacterium]
MAFFQNKTVLIISPEFWGRSYLSKHHYAECLAESGNVVYFLDPPGITKSSDAINAEKRYPGKLFIIQDAGIRGMRFLPQWLARKVMRRQLHKLENKYNTKFDVIWSFDNSRYFLLDASPHAFSIHHLVDLEVDFHLEAACRSAKVCFAVTHTILDRMKVHNNNAHYIQHGYRPLPKTTAKLPMGKGNLKAVYIGNLLMSNFDIELFKELASQNPETDFYLIGSYGFGNLNANVDTERAEAIRHLEGADNIYLLGERTPSDTYTMVDEADILLLMYFKYHRKVDNSSKLPPYLASGKVILADRVTEYENTGLLEMAETREAYLVRFREICANIDQFNSKENQARRRQYAMDHTYAKQLSRIESILNGLPLHD